MNRKFFTLLLLAAMMIAAGSMACINTVTTIEITDETDSAT
ncbi:hypothetical protein [Nannocystis sp.]|nr:hypothetical protein [Nannocystis sp.]